MYVLKKVGNQWLADDLTQETFVRAFRKLSTLKDRSKIKSWLIRIARNLCTDYFRSGKNKMYSPLDSDITEGSLNENSVERSVQKEQMSRCVQKQMENLPEAQRDALWLFDRASM